MTYSMLSLSPCRARAAAQDDDGKMLFDRKMICRALPTADAFAGLLGIASLITAILAQSPP